MRGVPMERATRHTPADAIARRPDIIEELSGVGLRRVVVVRRAAKEEDFRPENDRGRTSLELHGASTRCFHDAPSCEAHTADVDDAFEAAQRSILPFEACGRRGRRWSWQSLRAPRVLCAS